MTAPIAWKREYPAPLKRFQVLGERSCGTNFMDVLLARNTGLERTRDYGWKHSFPQFSSVLRDDLLVICFRDPETWLRSMYVKPWHVPDARVNVTFSEFLRAPWETVMDMPGAMNAVGRRQSLGLPAQGDRHPITGLPPANPVRLRNLKNAAFLGVLERRCNVALIRHEDLTLQPQDTVGQICDLFGIAMNQGEFFVPARRLGEMTQRSIQGDRRDATATYSDSDRAFVRAELDHETEQRLGYSFT